MTENEQKRRVILLSGNHTTQSLWQPLSEHYDICLAHPQMSGLMTELGIAGGFGLHKYLTAETQENAVNVAYEMTSRLYDKEFSASLAQVIDGAFEGDAPTNLTMPQVGKWWPSMVGEHLRNEVLIVDMLEGLFNDRQVSGCIVHEDVTPDARAIVLFCKTKGIPTIHVPHANCYYTGDGWDIHTESISDYIAAAGTYMSEWYTKWGYNKEHITICGVPQLDSWYGGDPPSRKEARRVLGWDAQGLDYDAFCLIYATSWAQLTSSRGGFDDEMGESLRQAFEAARELGAVLCVKMHPGEGQGQEQVYLNAMKEYGVTGFVTRQFNEYVLRAGDVLLAHGPSNICTASSMIGLPSAYIPTQDYLFPFPGPVRVGDNATHALKIAMMLDKGGTWDIFSKTQNDAHPVGNANERIVEMVTSLCPSR